MEAKPVLQGNLGTQEPGVTYPHKSRAKRSESEISGMAGGGREGGRATRHEQEAGSRK